MVQPSDVEELPLRERAYLHIKRLILNEELPPNSFLSERSLAQQLGMSKTPVRLAIARPRTRVLCGSRPSRALWCWP